MTEVSNTILRIPEDQIVVTRKVPMTDLTCSQLRDLRHQMELVQIDKNNQNVEIPYPVVISRLIDEAHKNSFQ